MAFKITSKLKEVKVRSSHQGCSVRKDVIKNFAKFRGKHLCQGLFFNKVSGLRPATLLKKRLWHRCFAVNFAKFLRTPFLRNTYGPLLNIILNVLIIEISSNTLRKYKTLIAIRSNMRNVISL